MQFFLYFDIFLLNLSRKHINRRLLELLDPTVYLRLVDAKLNSAMVFSPQRADKPTLALKAGE